jgi:OOP family OmpA-OmpF porin
MRPFGSFSLSFSLVFLLATGAQAGFTADVLVPGPGEGVVVNQAYILSDSSSTVDSAGLFMPEQELVQAFTAGMPNGSYESGAAAFGGGTRLEQPISAFHRGNMTGWSAAIPNFRGDTPLSAQFDRVGRKLAGKGGHAAVVVFSDGLPNLYGQPDAEGALESARRMAAAHGGKVCIYPVQVGGDTAGAGFMDSLSKVSGCGSMRTADAISNAGALNAYQREIFLGRQGPIDTDSDGVYDSSDRCPGTPRGAVVDSRGCWVIRGLNFDTNKSDIKPQYQGRLDNVVRVLKNAAGVRISVDGHTDARGSEAYNQALSQRRAQAVADYLVKGGIARDRLVVNGRGESSPMAPNDTAENMYLNRRTELNVID